MDASSSPASALDRKVGEIMRTDLTTVRPGISVRELTRILSDEGISGAPVTAGDGRLLGVVSSTDVVRFAAEVPDLHLPLSFAQHSTGRWGEDAGEDDEAETVVADYFLPEAGPGMVAAMGDEAVGGAMDDMTVEDIMTPVPFTVSPGTTLRELANFLLRGRIHRALVAEDERCVGIVTTTDVLRAVAEGV